MSGPRHSEIFAHCFRRVHARTRKLALLPDGSSSAHKCGQAPASRFLVICADPGTGLLNDPRDIVGREAAQP